MNVNIMSVNLSEVAAGTALIFKAPSDSEGGGITVLGGYVVGGGTATVALQTFSNAGTPALNGTICAAAGGTLASTVPSTFSISDGWVDGGEYVGAVVTGTVNDGTFLSLRYAMGK